jgi:segregation and condensation protein B
MTTLNQNIEALIFCSEQSISVDEIAASLKISFGWELTDEEILSAIEEIKLKYQSGDFAFELVEIAEGFQFLTKKDYHAAVSALIQHKSKKKLSSSAMETLAIIAYKQPITKGEVEHIRGVNCDYAIQKLLEKELIEIQGKSDTPGKPLLYATSKSFMDYFGISTVSDLPQLKDLHVEQNEIGEPQEFIEEPVKADAIAKEEIVEETIIREEIVDLDDAVEITDLPDRKAIFMDHQEKISESQNEITSEDTDENTYNSPGD